jgi:glycosyltransferase involved in cell wall biosynthesis
MDCTSVVGDQIPITRALSILRIYHSGVVSTWRQRDRELIALGNELRLVCPIRWNEGGRDVVLQLGEDESFVSSSRTIGRHPYGFLFNPLPIWRELRRRSIDVLDVHEEPASLAALEILVLRALSRSHSVVTFYGAQNIEKRFPPPFRWIEQWALKAASGVHVCNEEAGDIFVRKGFRGHVSVIGLGVDVERFSPASEPHANRPFTIGYVGRLERHKGVSVVIDALSVVPDARLIVVGDGPERQRLEAHAERIGVSHRVFFEGFANHDELPATYRRFDLSVVPSLTTDSWVEQFGRVAIEAMASGVPVLASRSGALPWVLRDAGALAAPEDPAAWAEAINQLVADEQIRNQLVERGLRRAHSFSWPSIAKAHSRLYQEVMK